MRVVLAAALALAIPTADARPMPRIAYAQHRAAMTARAAAVAARNRAAVPYAPAPPHYQIVYDNGAGYNAGSTDAQSAGQYADTTTNTVHTTRGFSRRQIAQDVGQLVGYNVLSDGDRHYFSRLLGTDPAYWTDLHANSAAGGREAGDEAFANYYSVAATGGLRPGESVAIGNTSIDPERLRQFAAALRRLGKRHQLKPYKP